MNLLINSLPKAKTYINMLVIWRGTSNRMSYLEMRSDGWVIGSGMVENDGKRFKDCFAKAGMR
jgi:hypothetical protein